MSIKQDIVKLLESSRDRIISGQELAAQLGVSRTAVWKAVNALRKEGYQVEAATNRGYRLADSTDCLSEEGIRLSLDPIFSANKIFVLDTVDSTNNYAKQRALAGGGNGEVVVANEQTAGRGRLGRSFFSPADTGIYMSFLLQPCLPLEEAVLFTLTAAVAVCMAVEACTDKKPQIKWVNDIFLDGKKICGILTEAISDFETGVAQSVIVGIGLNVKTEQVQFPKALRSVAASLNTPGLQRNYLAACEINYFLRLAGTLDRAQILREYKKRSFVLGRTIQYIKNGVSYTAQAVDINEQGNLIVRFSDGTQDVLRSGEISIGSGSLT